MIVRWAGTGHPFDAVLPTALHVHLEETGENRPYIMLPPWLTNETFMESSDISGRSEVKSSNSILVVRVQEHSVSVSGQYNISGTRHGATVTSQLQYYIVECNKNSIAL